MRSSPSLCIITNEDLSAPCFVPVSQPEPIANDGNYIIHRMFSHKRARMGVVMLNSDLGDTEILRQVFSHRRGSELGMQIAGDDARLEPDKAFEV